MKLSSAAKSALFIIKVPPNQAGQFNIVTVQPHLNAVNGLNGIVNGIGAPINGAVVVNNLNGLPLNNLTSLANLNTTLSSALNGGLNNSTTATANNNNNNSTSNNNNTLQFSNCKLVSVATPVAVQKVHRHAFDENLPSVVR